MSATATVPVIVTPEAADHVRQLGLEREFAQILDYVQRTAPELLRIEAVLDYDPDAPVPDAVLIRTVQPEPDRTDLTWKHAFNRWIIATYPPAIGVHFVLMPGYEARHGR